MRKEQKTLVELSTINECPVVLRGEVVRGSVCGAACREISLAASNPELGLVWCSPQPASLIPFLRRLRSLVPTCLSFLSVLDRCAALCAILLVVLQSRQALPQPILSRLSAPTIRFTASHSRAAPHSVPPNACACTPRPVIPLNIAFFEDWVVRQQTRGSNIATPRNACRDEPRPPV